MKNKNTYIVKRNMIMEGASYSSSLHKLKKLEDAKKVLDGLYLCDRGLFKEVFESYEETKNEENLYYKITGYTKDSKYIKIVCIVYKKTDTYLCDMED